MLQKISDRIQGWVAGTIIFIIAAVFGLWGIESYLHQGSNGSKPLATVNGQKITQKQVDQLYHQVKRQLEQAHPNQPMTVSIQRTLKAQALQQLIHQSAWLINAKKIGFHIDSRVIQQVVMSLPQLQVKGQFSPARFQQFLYASQLTESQFMKQMQDNFIVNQVQWGLAATGLIFPNRLQRIYRLIHQQRSFGYFVLPLKKFRSGLVASHKDLQTYYQQNKSDYKTPEQVKVSYLLLSPQAIEKTIKVSEAQLQAYYRSNKAAYTRPAQWQVLWIKAPLSKAASVQQVTTAEKKLKQLRVSLKRGQSFKALVKSSGLQSSTQALTAANASPTMLNVLMTLKPHQISQLFHTNDAVNLIKILSLTPKKTKSFAAVKSAIKARLLRQQAQQILSEKNDELSNLVYTNPSTLSVAAQQLGVSIQTSSWFSQQGAQQGIWADHRAVAVAFSQDVLQQGNNSNPIELKNGAVMVLRIAAHKVSKVKPFAAVKQAIKTILLKNKAEAKAGLQAYQVSSALSSGASPKALASRYGLQWRMQKNIQRTSKSIPIPILNAAFITVPAKGKDSPGVDTLVLANGDYVVLKVFSVKAPSQINLSSKRRQQLSQDISHLNGQLSYNAYAQSVFNQAKISLLSDKKEN
jgi:peptidyl-prolyl cis-trans isomerase D